ncbi:multicopper oxidase family protein [bacterium]|nr:multicopper oxidase family protein [bacterium]MCI0680302.1 multicopper oxidase family protein [bacterium]
MKNQNILYIIIGVVILAGGYFFLSESAPVPSREAAASPVVELKNGDTYDLTAGYVAKTIGDMRHAMLAYNGSIPGPIIKVAQGAEITINFKNNTDIPALLHSHGVRMDNAFDGSQLQQKEMKPGESFSYKLKFPDAGIYWYHPHAKEVYGQGLGLYGAFIVAPADSDYFPPVNREIPLFLSDAPIENGKIALDKDMASHSLMGHYGNVMLINGEDAYNLDAQTGEAIRLYVVNAANARPFNFAIEGLKLKLVGADNGAYERASFIDSVVISPSERAIIDIFIPNAGIYEIQNKTPNRVYALGTISAKSDHPDISYAREFDALQTNQGTIQSINPFRAFFDQEPTKHLALTIDMGGDQMPMESMNHGGRMAQESPDGIEWDDANQMMNRMSNAGSIKWKIVDRDTGKENMDIDWTFTQDTPMKIRIFNDPDSMHPMQHPIHFHGQRFLVIARDGAEQTNLAWKDTVLVKAGETVDIILDPSNPGEWMAHCHISEHLEAGMIFRFRVK